MRRRNGALPAAAAAAVLCVLYATPVADSGVRKSQVPPEKSRVLVQDNYFEPRSTEIVRGGKVAWKWRGENRHSVRFTKVPKGASRRGAKPRRSGHWRRSFKRTGRYRYVCTLWSGMRGTIHVRANPQSARKGKRRRSVAPREPERVLGDVVQDHLP